ncbi:MAG TPA: hypothetical protein V6D17_08730 [Candidatus Obscuribacterales bacterium]
MSSSRKSDSKSTSTDPNQAGNGADNRPRLREAAPTLELEPIKIDILSERLGILTDNFRFQEIFPPPPNITQSLAELKDDLMDVPVRAADGSVTNVYNKIECEDCLTREDKDLIWSCLAMVRDSFQRMDRSSSQHGSSYQWNMNWKHTRSEVGEVLEASKLLGLNNIETRDAILASIFSDSIKNRKNFIIHNVHGAYGAAQALSYFLDFTDPKDMASVEQITRAVREHQIAPPQFMANVVAILLCKKLNLGTFDPEGQEIKQANSEYAAVMAVVKSIWNKINDPYRKEFLTEDLSKIDFTPAERQLLVNIGISDWYVPHPDNAESKIAHAVIAGDHSINYNHPEGFAKIALLRGPDTEAIFEDPTIHHSLDSAVNSFADSFRVIRPEVQKLAIEGLRRTKGAMERVIAIMSELFSGLVVGPTDPDVTGLAKISSAMARAQAKHPLLFSFATSETFPEASKEYMNKTVTRIGEILQDWLDSYGEIPFSPKCERTEGPGPGKLPFWNAPLKYPTRNEYGMLNVRELDDLELRQFLFAGKIREIAVELLRAEQWIF